jgi:FMN phosphatase YigB (HAD superfamily)
MKNSVVVIDIDGVLADYRMGLLYWIRQSRPDLAQKANMHINRADTWIDHSSMGISYRKWLDTLEMFRMSGGKQSIPVYDGAVELIEKLQRRDYEIVLLTSRPIDIYSNIYRDTVEWLRNNSLNHDMLLWSKSKAEMVYKMRLTDKVAFAIDDEFKHIEDYDRLGINTFWIDLYKKGEGVHMLENCTRVESLKDIIEYLEIKNEQS